MGASHSSDFFFFSVYGMNFTISLLEFRVCSTIILFSALSESVFFNSVF